ncbi:Sulfite exporter TauE/SafE family protein [Seminavis robusta]|uniref:Sulfite exporter TauE/SafE family protein n=1 Tax=Seminavis robusta TaxID=568900 RepID=A0A9N8F0Y7_9STRA|nr:Sulfite exporter TauE/SafE family protein [Seminavis robusta]|eukprot:Sro2493_g329220.1 Sulfite exporter TauE/SafE family protein (634) ;mRNA; f:4997-6995
MTSLPQLRFLLLSLLLLISSCNAGAADDDKCAASKSYQCPYLTEVCGNNQTVFVSDCLEDCQGYRNTDSTNEVCFDRRLLSATANPDPSYLWRDILGILVWFAAAGVATACGVGGGGIYVPLGILLLQFAPKPSSGLSQASIFGASLGGLLLNSRNQHPYTTQVQVHASNKTDDEDGEKDSKPAARIKSIPTSTENNNNDDNRDCSTSTQCYTRPLIDFDMALFLAPMEMAGAVLGVLIQKILPNWLYLTLAAIILGFTAYKTYRKFFDMRKAEKLLVAKEQGAADATLKDAEKTEDSHINDEQPTSPPPEEPTTNGNHATDDNDQSADQPHQDKERQTQDNGAENNNTSSTTSTSTATAATVNLERCQYWLEQDQRQFPVDKLLGLLILWIGLVLLTFFKGGKGVDSLIGIDCTSPWYATLIAIQFAWTLGFAAFYGYKLQRATQDKIACGYHFHPNDVLWDLAKIRFYSFFTFIAGIVAGLIGIGGGMVLGPLMLVMGIHPRVSSATTATMIVLTSSSVAVLFVTAGLVPWEYALTFFCVCFLGACVGKTVIDGYVKRTNRASLLIFLLATIIALATVGCMVIVLTRLAQADWCFAGFNKFCSIATDEDEDEVVCTGERLLAFVTPTKASS